MAMATLVREYERPVYNAALRMLGNPEDAADVAQTVFVKVFERIGQFKPGYRLFSWVYRIAINESIDQLHRRGRTTALDSEPADPGAAPEASVSADQASEQLQPLLMALPEDYRAVLILRYFAELNYEQMALVLEIPSKTVKSRLYSARQLLKKQMTDSGMVDV